MHRYRDVYSVVAGVTVCPFFLSFLPRQQQRAHRGDAGARPARSGPEAGRGQRLHRRRRGHRSRRGDLLERKSG